jgi:acyl-CoA thioesterase-2
VASIRSAWPDHPGYRIDLVPCVGTARVRVGETLLAESTRAFRVIETDHVERLYFPEDDVRLELLTASDRHTICPFKGQASYWSSSKTDPSVEDLFWAYHEPFPEVAGIRGHLGVYHERAEVEIETSWDDTKTTNRFPPWGDLLDLVGLVSPEPAGPGRFQAPCYHVRERNVVEGGQLLGQAVVAASRHLPDQRVTWASATFSRTAGFDEPIELAVDELHRGRTFSTLAVRSEQRGKLISPALLLMDSGAPDTIRGVDRMPDVGDPADAPPYDMGVAGRAVRIVEGAYSPDPDRTGPPVIHAWVRLRENPAEHAVRQAVLVQATTHWTVAAAMLPHPGIGEAQAHFSLSTGPVALTVSFHDDAPLDEWFLYSTRAIWSGSGLAQGDGRVWTAGGSLLASFSLQAMLRGLLASGAGRDPSTLM